MSLFTQRVLAYVKTIPSGRVSTYKLVAQAIKLPRAVRAVGRALNSNELNAVEYHGPCQVPCHRVVMSDGSLGGFRLGQEKKITLLQQEGIVIKHGKIVNFKDLVWSEEN